MWTTGHWYVDCLNRSFPSWVVSACWDCNLKFYLRTSTQISINDTAPTVRHCVLYVTKQNWFQKEWSTACSGIGVHSLWIFPNLQLAKWFVLKSTVPPRSHRLFRLFQSRLSLDCRFRKDKCSLPVPHVHQKEHGHCICLFFGLFGQKWMSRTWEPVHKDRGEVLNSGKYDAKVSPGSRFSLSYFRFMNLHKEKRQEQFCSSHWKCGFLPHYPNQRGVLKVKKNLSIKGNLLCCKN